MSHKVLLADSSAAIHRVVELMFAAEDVEVVGVEDGQQAIDRLAAEAPDVVLADIGAPRRSGYEVAAFVAGHPQLSHVPVLLLAGAFDPVDDARATQVGSAGVLVKPLEPQQVVARVRALLESTRRRADPPGRGPTASAPLSAARQSDGRLATGAAVAPEPPRARMAPPASPPALATSRSDPAVASLDDYFDRLDAAFATLGTRPALSPPPSVSLPHVDGMLAPADIPTIEDVLGSADTMAGAETSHPGRAAAPPAEPAEMVATPSEPPSRPRPRSGASEALADLFHLLLAAERGEADLASLRPGGTSQPLAVTDELVEQVTRRVVQRLGTSALREMVADLVSDVAERLVREEIDRIRRG